MSPKSVEQEIRDEFAEGKVYLSSANYLLVLVDTLRAELEALRRSMPPSARGQGIVGEGSWAVFAEKVVAERDEAREKCAELQRRLDDLILGTHPVKTDI